MLAGADRRGVGFFTWAHVGLRASSTSIRLGIRRQTKITQENLPAIPRNEDILWFQVFVKHPFRVDEIKGVADLKNDLPHPPIVSSKRVASFVDVS